MSTPASLTVRWTVPPGEARSALDVLLRLVADARRQRGCRQCSVQVAISNRARIAFVGEWADEDALEQELRSYRFAWLTSLIEASSEPPIIEFRVPAGCFGAEYAEAIRDRATG